MLGNFTQLQLHFWVLTQFPVHTIACEITHFTQFLRYFEVLLKLLQVQFRVSYVFHAIA